MSIRSLLETMFGAGTRSATMVDPAPPIDDNRTLRIARAPLKAQPAAIRFIGAVDATTRLLRQ